MSDERVRRALDVFREVCELPAGERAAFLDTALSGDPALRAEVDSMLAADEADEEGEAEDETSPSIRAVLSDLARDAETEKTPERVGGYRIVKLIARGGMGAVYEARQENPDRKVAIKLAHVGGTTSERARRFELEAQLLARLRHPGIAQIIEAGTTSSEEGSQPYFVMELVEGESLTRHADAHAPSAREKLELAARVCEIVGFAHAEGVIHRDLKPDNVLIEANGAPKVLDFGVAKVEDAGGFGAATLRTEAGRVIGTLGYMAPEQLGGETEALHPAADVYSLGVMLYELLTGRLPHELDAVTLSRALAVVTTTDAPLLGVVRPEYRGDIEAVVAKALEKNPRHRYPDAAALGADLGRYLGGEPTRARPAGPLLKLVKWTRRNPAMATGLLGIFLAITTVAIVLLVKNREVRTALEENRLLLDASQVRQAYEDADADRLWPTRAAQIGALEHWLATYDALVERLSLHRAALARLSAPSVPPDPRDRTPEEEARAREYTTLVDLVRDLEALDADTALFERVNGRLSLARTIEARSVTSRRADWDAAARRVAESRVYQGRGHPFTLTPQVGLVPLGRNPDSGLEEFLHVETHAGELPSAGGGERIELAFDENTGLVFVLLPGGDFLMGARKDEPGAWPHEKPRHPVSVQPFFLSKHEMTVAQWKRLGVHGRVPTLGAFKQLSPAERMRQPVVGVSRDAAAKMMRRLGLVLPHEQQWEYAARADTTTYWPVGDRVTDLLKKANVCGKEAHRANPNFIHDWDEELEDDHPEAAGVGYGDYPPNRWGLHNMIGNVSAWCANKMYPYPGAKPFENDPRGAVFRGGNYYFTATRARAAMRYRDASYRTMPFVGVRPAMPCATG